MNGIKSPRNWVKSSLSRYQIILLVVAGLNFVAALLFVAFLLGRVALVKFLPQTQFFFPYLGVMGLLVLLIVIGRSWLTAALPRDWVWLNPPLIMMCWTFVMIVLPGLNSFFDNSGLDLIRWVKLESIAPSMLVKGMFLFVIGYMCLFFAYLIGLQIIRPFTFIKRLTWREPTLRWLMIFYAVSFVAQIVQILIIGIAYKSDSSQLGGFSSIRQWIGYIQDIYWVILAIVAVKVFRREWRPQSLIVIIVVQVGLNIISGFMKSTLLLGIVVLLAALIAHVNLKRFWILALIMAMLAIAIVPIAQNLRDQLDRREFDPRNISSIVAATGRATENTWLRGFSVGWDLFTKRTLGRQALIAYTPGVIMVDTPSYIPYQGIKKFIEIPALFIPRVIWPSKPDLNNGTWFTIHYFKIPQPYASSAAITVFGEGYMFAGKLGTVLVGVILGFLLAFLYRNTASGGLLPILLALVPTFIDVEGQFSGMFVALVEKWFIYIFFYFLVIQLSAVGTKKPLLTTRKRSVIVNDHDGNDKQDQVIDHQEGR